MSNDKFIVQVTFHSAHNIPVADINTLSSDPYIHATTTPLSHSSSAQDESHPHISKAKGHHGQNKEGEHDHRGEHPPLAFRTPTVRRSRDPVWTKAPPTSLDAVKGDTEKTSEPAKPRRSKDRSNAANDSSANSDLPSICQWVIGGVSASGFQMVLRLRDEDPGDTDDRLGKALVVMSEVSEGKEISEKKYEVKKRRGSPLVYVQTYLAAIGPKRKVNRHAYVVISVRVLGKDNNEGGHGLYTVGPGKPSLYRLHSY